jgi:hypothetical protein
MKQRPRIYYSDSQKALMWERGGKEQRSIRLPGCLIEGTRRCIGSLLRQAEYGRQSGAVQVGC